MGIEAEAKEIRLDVMKEGYRANTGRNTDRNAVPNGNAENESGRLSGDLSGVGSDADAGTNLHANFIAAGNSMPGGEIIPARCGECRHHCYHAEGPMPASTQETAGASKREPQRYTHYCLKTPSGFRKLRHATDWSGCEAPPKWCPLKADVAASGNACRNDQREGGQ